MKISILTPVFLAILVWTSSEMRFPNKTPESALKIAIREATGMVEITKDCGVSICVQNERGTSKYFTESLPKRLQKSGVNIQFSYYAIPAPTLKNCGLYVRVTNARRVYRKGDK